eukprot:1991161-Pleurochrysis_carterae.AAC.2
MAKRWAGDLENGEGLRPQTLNSLNRMHTELQLLHRRLRNDMFPTARPVLKRKDGRVVLSVRLADLVHGKFLQWCARRR